MPPRKKLQRPLGERRYRKLFVIAVEGAKTEHQYFAMFNDRSVVRVYCIESRHDSSPSQVLKRMVDQLKKESLKESDEAWLVVDKDHWSDEQLTPLHQWTRHAKNYGFALSNPKFEYWLLLHFEDGAGIASSRDCTNRLKRYVPGFDKGVSDRDFTKSRIDDAITRAKRRDNPPCVDWPRDVGSTTVYKLVENLLRVE